ncbi:acidic endochitinase-like [Ziziphus jujuba]|uniref:Acidic endochitinase-like n=1 Tax=Ziziphus jujuba TaxID=326968 RepID=A0ABM4AGL7_ZIZJJ|nr:acidic endochitinase-like [Ziziphus jujuba]
MGLEVRQTVAGIGRNRGLKESAPPSEKASIRARRRTADDGGLIAVYWAQNGNEGSLAKASNIDLYAYINIAFLMQFGNGRDLVLNLAGHCDPAWNTCTKFGQEIKTCQSKGIKVLISIGGAVGSYSLSFANDAKNVANIIWNSYLGGTDSSATCPYGDDAVLDSVDFDIVNGSTVSIVDRHRW